MCGHSLGTMLDKYEDQINRKTVTEEVVAEDSDDEDEYTFTDCSDSEDSSVDSRLEIPRGKSKIQMRKEVNDEDDPYSDVPLPDFSDDEKKAAEYFTEWTKALADPSRKIVKELQEKYGDTFPCCTCIQEPDEKSIVNFIGETDDEGKMHGEVEINYDNCDYFWGDYNHGVREGMASIVLKNEDNYVGSFKAGYLEGLVVETITCCGRQNVEREVYYSKGVRHGFYREMGPDRQFWAVGRFVNGRKAGVHWCWARGNCYLVGPVDADNKPHGENIFYLYPDLTTTLRGDFTHGKMSLGKTVELTGIQVEGGIPAPKYREHKDGAIYKYDPSGAHCISRTPLVRDVYEARYVRVAESGVAGAGEGLWAKTRIRAGQACSLFNGVRQHALWGSPAMADTKAWSDYRIGCAKDRDLDILPQHRSTLNYRATLAHKTCTSFTPNSHFAQFWHPRFGLIMSIVVDRDIMAGEEIFVCYNYVIALAPAWYQEQWFHHLREELRWTEEQIHSWAARTNKLNGLTVNIPPPP